MRSDSLPASAQPDTHDKASASPADRDRRCAQETWSRVKNGVQFVARGRFARRSHVGYSLGVPVPGPASSAPGAEPGFVGCVSPANGKEGGRWHQRVPRVAETEVDGWLDTPEPPVFPALPSGSW